MQKLKYQFELIRAIRNFFEDQDFLEVLTPPMVQNPGMETHIHPFQVFSKNSNSLTDFYLHTSPEFHMKKLLAEQGDLNDIYTLSYCFRDEPSSPIHRSQFLMLEWYRKNHHYQSIMNDVENLVRYTHTFFKDNHLVKKSLTEFPQVTVKELFLEYAQFDILNFLETQDLKEKIQFDHKDVPLPSSDCQWDDYFFLIFLNKIEPHFKNHPYLLVKEYPAPLSALSTLKESDPRVCERFEVYMNGVELCNSFNELTDYEVLKKRFEQQAKDKKDLYKYELPWPSQFMDMMKTGYPKSAGIALGVERLLTSILNTDQIFFE